jgi:hypothetical protein
MTSTSGPVSTMTGTARPAEWAIRLLVVAGLAVDAYVHLDLAANQQLAAPGGIGGGTLFRLQAAVAAVVGLLVLLSGRRWAYALAFLAGLSALIPVLLYTYVDVPAFGPIPSMYEPIWYPEKVLSVVAEAAVVVLSVAGWFVSGRIRRNTAVVAPRSRRLPA